MLNALRYRYHLQRARRAGLKINAIKQVRSDACVQIELPASLGSTQIRSINPPSAPLLIGAHTYVRSGTISMVESLGRYCSIGQAVLIGEDPQAHPLDWASTSPAINHDYTSPFQAPERYTVIGHDVWIGHGAVIMAGVHIGTGAIVGGNAVVTRDVPPYHIAVGNPARIVRMRVEESLAADLLASEWWLRDHAGLVRLRSASPREFAAEALSLPQAAPYPKLQIHQRKVRPLSDA